MQEDWCPHIHESNFFWMALGHASGLNVWRRFGNRMSSQNQASKQWTRTGKGIKKAIQLQHRQMSHIESRRIANTAASDKISGLTYYGGFNRIGCHTCMRMQGQKGKFKRRAWTRSTVPGQRVHSDIKEVDVRTKMGQKYIV